MEQTTRGKKENGMINDLEYIELPDKRLTERLGRLVEQLSAAPDRSIPEACEGWHETKAAYRFFR